MARRRRKSSGGKRRRSRKGMSEGKSFMSAGRKSRRRKGGRKRRRGMSEAFSGNNVHKAAKTVFSGMLGGATANVINRFEMPGLLRAAVNLGASFVASNFLDSPNMGAGIAGAYGMLLTQQLQEGSLKEDYDYADPNVLSEYSQFADANGNPMYLAQDGNLYYLEEGQEGMNLADGVYPNYINASNY